MNKLIARTRFARVGHAVLLTFVAWSVAWNGSLAATRVLPIHDAVTLAQNTAQVTAPQATPAAQARSPSDALSWTFGTPPRANGEGWTAERGAMTLGEGEARLQPDGGRRVVLLSPSDLPKAAGFAEEFVLGVSGTGLERVRIQARRDVRGGWITIADASGAALRETADGYVIKRNSSVRAAPVERLRFELQFRTTNTRALRHIAAR